MEAVFVFPATQFPEQNPTKQLSRRINQTTSELQSFSSSKVPNARDPRNTGKYEIYSRRTSRRALSRSAPICSEKQVHRLAPEKPNSKGGPHSFPGHLSFRTHTYPFFSRRPRNDLECLVRRNSTLPSLLLSGGGIDGTCNRHSIDCSSLQPPLENKLQFEVSGISKSFQPSLLLSGGGIDSTCNRYSIDCSSLQPPLENKLQFEVSGARNVQLSASCKFHVPRINDVITVNTRESSADVARSAMGRWAVASVRNTSNQLLYTWSGPLLWISHHVPRCRHDPPRKAGHLRAVEASRSASRRRARFGCLISETPFEEQMAPYSATQNIPNSRKCRVKSKVESGNFGRGIILFNKKGHLCYNLFAIQR
ncbi:hypothetical protein K0M31_013890, partial [Melipona bicolor]